jgi:hypothetical protein
MTTPPPFPPKIREAKLPVWAQELLDSYRAKISAQHNEIAQLKGELPPSNVRIMAKMGNGHTFLPPNAMVRFDQGWGSVMVCHELDGTLRIQGDGPINIRPEATNCVHVRLEGN